MRRKAIKLANNTLVMSLPSSWVKRTRLNKGDEIDLQEFENKLILSVNNTSTEGRITVDVSGMDPMVKRMLGALYKSGYDEVKVKFSTIKELKAVQEVIREEFLGFEVVDQKKDWLVFRKVSHIEPREFSTMMRRMFLIILSMADDSLDAMKKKDKEWLEAIALHDKDVNKIADFCRRVLNTTGAEGYKRIPPGYFMVEQLEKIGDMYRDICKQCAVKPFAPSKGLESIYRETNSFFRSFYGVYFNFDLLALRDFARQRYRLREVFDDAIGSLPKKEVKILFFLNNVVESAFDMNGPLMAVNL
ncbi:TPA: phosphate uptake regulator PhoU [Candidatus Woesearchaeota archaeon]|nr:phosphate uptake regulator PhoU [Candidatus Woesearchaeota archaeon]